jgi:hypothetical protein
MKDLSIIIVNYRTYHLTRQTLESVLEKDHPFSYDIYLVDNASGDGSLEKLQKDFQDVDLVNFIKSNQNQGFAHANNLALENINSKHVLLLNSDTQVMGDCLEKCLEYLEHHQKTGVLGCKVLLADGSLDLACRRSFPTFSVSFYRMTGLSRLFPKSKRFGQYNLTYLDEDETYPVDCVVGAFMMVRWATVEEVGFLDEDFFMYGEDIDWCYRIKSAGWEVVYYSPAQIIHYKGGSGANQKLLNEFYRSMYIFYKKHYEKQYPWYVTALTYGGIGGIWGLKLLFLKIRKFFKYLAK